MKLIKLILYSTQLEKAEYEKIQKTIASSETATKKILHQRKFKKYNNLKYKPKPAVKATNITDENENLQKATYTDILQTNKIPLRGLSKTNNTDHNNRPYIQEKLRSLNPTNRHRRQGNSPSRKLANSNIKNNDKYEQKINELQEEIKKLKHAQETPAERTVLITTENSAIKSKDISKSETTDWALNRDQHENIDLFTVINFVEQTMQTLSNYREQLKTQLDFNLTLQGMQ